MPTPKWWCQRRLTITRVKSGLSPRAIHSASFFRRSPSAAWAVRSKSLSPGTHATPPGVTSFFGFSTLPRCRMCVIGTAALTVANTFSGPGTAFSFAPRLARSAISLACSPFSAAVIAARIASALTPSAFGPATALAFTSAADNALS